MSLKKNIIANYASQLYVTGVGILILPLYIKYMGAEAYGLVGFFTMLQAWFGLLDMGLTPTIGRETARYHGGSMSALAYRQLFRALSLIFLAVALVGGSGLFFVAELVAEQWLQIESLDMNSVVIAVQIMAISVALRWMCGLYRGVVTGSERLVWLSGFNALIATLRFIAVFVSMWQFGFKPLVFFMHQLAVALIELAGLCWMGNRLLPVALDKKIGWSFKPIKPVLKFALTIAFTSSIWVLVTQTDKLILSGILPLDEYGFFTLAVILASGIMVISVPLTSVIQPRITRLYAEKKNRELYSIYLRGAQIITIFPFFVALVIAFFPYQVIILWTGDTEIAINTSEVLRYYVLGSGFLSLAAFPSILQNAYGSLKYHFIGNILILVFLVPCSVYFSLHHGAKGASLVWLFVNLSYLFLWVTYSHFKLIPGKQYEWLLDGMIKPALPFIIVLLMMKFILNGAPNSMRIQAFWQLGLVVVFTYIGWYFIFGRVFINGLYKKVF